MQHLETIARFACPNCHGQASVKVEVSEPHWGAAERMSDLMSEDQTEVACNLCGEVFPAYVQNSSAGCVITLDDHPDTRVSADYAFFSPSDPDEWTNTQVPNDPFDVFVSSYHHVGDILAEYGADGQAPLSHSGPLINRMVFTQQITALEAYLGDTLVRGVLDGPDALLRLLTEDKELKATSVPLSAAARNPQIVRDTVTAHLQGILYHNLAKVAVLYRIALGVDVWPDEPTKTKLLVAIHQRHDCVHRNGRTKDGATLDMFTTAYVTDVLDTTVAFAKHIEQQLGRPRV